MQYSRDDMVLLGLTLCSNIEHALRQAKLSHIADQLENFGSTRITRIIADIDKVKSNAS